MMNLGVFLTQNENDDFESDKMVNEIVINNNHEIDNGDYDDYEEEEENEFDDFLNNSNKIISNNNNNINNNQSTNIDSDHTTVTKDFLLNISSSLVGGSAGFGDAFSNFDTTTSSEQFVNIFCCC